MTSTPSPADTFDIANAITKWQEGLQAAVNEIQPKEPDIYSFGAWSYSKYKSLRKCPFQFFLKYVSGYKVPPSLKIQDDPLSANVGSAAHLALEEIMKGKTFEKAMAIAKKKFVDTDKAMTEAQWTEHLDSLAYNIRNFKDRIDAFERQNPIKRVLTEIRVAFNKDFEPTGFFADDAFLRGVIDLVLILDCLDGVIIDHKHGGGEGGIKNYTEQLDWYKVMVHFGVQKLNAIQTGIHFIRMGDIKLEYSATASYDVENHLRNLLVMSIEGAVETLKSLGYYKHVRGSYCKWCEFDNLGCKDGTLKPLELSTRKFISITAVPG
jgi:hypothetical protein